MANTAVEIPFYVAKDGEPLTGASAQMEFDSLRHWAGQINRRQLLQSVRSAAGGTSSVSAMAPARLTEVILSV